MKITMYVLYGAWSTAETDGVEVLGVSEQIEPLLDKLHKISENRAADYIELFSAPDRNVSINEGERFYDIADYDGNYARFYITEHPVEISEMLMRKISREMKKIDRTNDIEEYLRGLYEENDIEPWRYEFMVRNPEVIKKILRIFNKTESCNTPYNTTMEQAISQVMKEISLDKGTLEYLWKEFGDILIDDNECILDDFLGFKCGTHREEVWHWFDERYDAGVAGLMFGDGQKNTKISYLYRDACNYKQHNEVTVSGTFTEDQIETIMGCLSEGEYFIPNQIGFPEVRFGSITEDDHCWFELWKTDFKTTNAKPDIDMTADEVVEKFLRAKGNWNDGGMQSE